MTQPSVVSMPELLRSVSLENDSDSEDDYEHEHEHEFSVRESSLLI